MITHSFRVDTTGEMEVDIFHGLADGHYEGLHAVLAGEDVCVIYSRLII